jgi:hypothetical protein
MFTNIIQRLDCSHSTKEKLFSALTYGYRTEAQMQNSSSKLTLTKIKGNESNARNIDECGTGNVIKFFFLFLLQKNYFFFSSFYDRNSAISLEDREIKKKNQ